MTRGRFFFGLILMAIGMFVIWQMNDLRSKSEAAPHWPHGFGSITTSELDYEKEAKIRYRTHLLFSLMDITRPRRPPRRRGPSRAFRAL